jgi:hypothetical protein
VLDHVQVDEEESLIEGLFEETVDVEGVHAASGVRHHAVVHQLVVLLEANLLALEDLHESLRLALALHDSQLDRMVTYLRELVFVHGLVALVAVGEELCFELFLFAFCACFFLFYWLITHLG